MPIIESLLFVHSPLVGPSSLRPIANLAATKGIQVIVPDLTAVAASNRPHHYYTSTAIEAAKLLDPPISVVGHSGAGAFLPTIGAALPRLGALVFVDAVVPPSQGLHRTPDRMKQMLDEQTDDGLLRRWLDWWPPDVVAQLLPEPADRDALAADMPQLPRAFYDTDVSVPTDWSDLACAYVQLSDAYAAERQEASTRYWPTITLESTHLGVYTDPGAVFDAIPTILDQI